MNFATLQGLTIPEGVVTQITDASGRVLWSFKKEARAVLQVAKQTLTTYAGETAYANENFVAIDVYPKTNGTVNITYGGLTKTITDTSGVESPNAQTVYFGTLYGVSDTVETPVSGKLTIEGNFAAFGCGVYKGAGKGAGLRSNEYCGCITEVSSWGDITSIPDHAFDGCVNLTNITFPNGITSIGSYAFHSCDLLVLTSLPNSVVSIGPYAFYGCDSITSFIVPEGIENIENSTFEECRNLTYLVLPSTLKTIGSRVAFSILNTTTTLTINVLATTPPTYSGDNFALLINYGNNMITVPKGSLSAYQTANGWSEYTERMKEVS